MNNTDYSFMKTGYTNEPSKLSKIEQSQLLSVMTLFTENAIKISEKYVLYENRKEITDKDIILALKSQAMDYTDLWDTDDTKNKLSLLYKDIYNELSNNITDEQILQESIDNKVSKDTQKKNV